MPYNKLGYYYEYECVDKKCDWKGEYPNEVPLYVFLDVDPEKCENEFEFIKICPQCGKQVICDFH